MQLFYFLFLTFYLFLALACRPAATPVSISERPVSINDVPQTNVPMPPLKNIENLGWQDMNSKTRQTLGDLKGKVVVLDFWATYCPPCLEGIPHLVELQKNHKDLQIVGLHVGGEEDAPKVPEFAGKLKINYPLAFPDEGLSTVLLGGNSAIPQTFVFDREGRLVKKLMGFDENVKNQLDAAVLQALESEG